MLLREASKEQALGVNTRLSFVEAMSTSSTRISGLVLTTELLGLQATTNKKMCKLQQLALNRLHSQDFVCIYWFEHSFPGVLGRTLAFLSKDRLNLPLVGHAGEGRRGALQGQRTDPEDGSVYVDLR